MLRLRLEEGITAEFADSLLRDKLPAKRTFKIRDTPDHPLLFEGDEKSKLVTEFLSDLLSWFRLHAMSCASRS